MKVGSVSLQGHLEHLQSQGQYWFLRENVISALKFSENAFRKAVHRLIQQGKVNRIRGGFYTLVPPEYRATGTLPAAWFIDALMAHMKQAYYVSLLTAAAFHGVAHQQPMVFQVITDRPTRPITVGQLRIIFFHKKKILPHFYVPIKTSTGNMRVSTPEITAFDLVRYMNASGQVNHIATVLCELVEKLKPGSLAQLLNSDDVEIASAQRLGYLLEVLNLPVDLEPLSSALKKEKPIKRLLVMGSLHPILEYSRRWHILVNESVEPDEL